ncbi:MAG: enoyl-CoA hydratase-related protein, partial [Paracoccaceae bacterium]
MTIASQTNILDSALDARGILRLTLNDEKRRNALSEAMLNRLLEAIHAAGDDPEVRVVILASRGPAFCAGHDLKELTAARAEGDGGRAYFTKIMTLCASVMQAIVACPKPVIAEVRGV